MRRTRRSARSRTPRDDRGPAPGLAGIGIRQVELDDRAVEGHEGVVQHPGVVGEGSRVDDQHRGTGTAPRAPADQVGLAVGLQVVEVDAQLGGEPGGCCDDLVELCMP